MIRSANLFATPVNLWEDYLEWWLEILNSSVVSINIAGFKADALQVYGHTLTEEEEKRIQERCETIGINILNTWADEKDNKTRPKKNRK